MDIPDKQNIGKERNIYQTETIPETKYQKNKKAKSISIRSPGRKNPHNKSTNKQTHEHTNKQKQKQIKKKTKAKKKTKRKKKNKKKQ